MRRAPTIIALTCLFVALVWAPPASGAVRDVWIAAVPVSFNVVPNAVDRIAGGRFEPAQTIFPTVVYRRTTPGWQRPLRNSPEGNVGRDAVPGPLIRARVGDEIRVHFKNLDTFFNNPHSMHFHGVAYRPSSDGAFVPGVSGPDADVRPGQSWTYRLRAVRDSVGVWPYHDHSPSMHASIEGGMYGVLSILGRHDRRADREFVAFFSNTRGFETINGRAFVGNTPTYTARVGDVVQWDVLAIGSDHHTFHVHGHRWVGAGGVSLDTRTLGPAESFRVRWREQDPGTWLYHCHREDHMERGMIGLYRVLPRRGRRGDAGLPDPGPAQPAPQPAPGHGH